MILVNIVFTIIILIVRVIVTWKGDIDSKYTVTRFDWAKEQPWLKFVEQLEVAIPQTVKLISFIINNFPILLYYHRLFFHCVVLYFLSIYCSLSDFGTLPWYFTIFRTSSQFLTFSSGWGRGLIVKYCSGVDWKNSGPKGQKLEFKASF